MSGKNYAAAKIRNGIFVAKNPAFRILFYYQTSMQVATT